MSFYELKQAELEDLEGRGYAFTKKTVFGKSYQGVFFVENEDAVEELKEQDELTFSGIVYHRRRSRDPRLKKESFPIEILDVTSTRMGERIDFASAEQQ